MLSAYDIFGVSFAIADLQGRILGCDPLYSKLLGHAPQDLLGVSAHDLTHPEDRGDYLALVERVVREGTSVVVRKRSLKRDGSIVWVQNRLTLFHGPQGLQILAACRGVDPPTAVEPDPDPELARPASCASYVADISRQLAHMSHGAGLELTADLLGAASVLASNEAEMVVARQSGLN